MFEKIKKIGPPLFILFLSLLVILPYFKSGFFPTHDGVWVPVRLAEMIRELKDLQIPPRLSGFLNHGYGYPLFNFAYPFPYYLGTILYLLGFGLVGSTKLLFAATVPLSGIFMYLLSKEIWKSRTAGLISAIYYVFLPYRIVDLYARGSIGESISFVLFPLLCFFVLKKNTLLLAVSIAILITTHNIMAILFIPPLIILSILFKRNIFPGLVLGLGLSAFFWIPALLEKNYIYLSKIPIADRFLYFLNLKDLIIPKWGYGLPTNPDGFGYQIGWPQALIFIFAIILGFVKKAKTPLILAGLILCMSFLLFKISNPLWQLPFLKEINYPWTLLAPIGFLISTLAGFLVANRMTKILAITISIVAIVFCLPHAVPNSYTNFPDDFYQTNDATTTSSDELMPLWVNPKPFARPKETAVITSGRGVVETQKESSNEIKLKSTLETDSTIQINKIYYPGWVWNAAMEPSTSGLMNLLLKKGSHEIFGHFRETPLRKFANAVSGVSATVLFALFIVKLRTWLA